MEDEDSVEPYFIGLDLNGLEEKMKFLLMKLEYGYRIILTYQDKMIYQLENPSTGIF